MDADFKKKAYFFFIFHVGYAGGERGTRRDDLDKNVLLLQLFSPVLVWFY